MPSVRETSRVVINCYIQAPDGTLIEQSSLTRTQIAYRPSSNYGSGAPLETIQRPRGLYFDAADPSARLRQNDNSALGRTRGVSDPQVDHDTRGPPRGSVLANPVAANADESSRDQPRILEAYDFQKVYNDDGSSRYMMIPCRQDHNRGRTSSSREGATYARAVSENGLAADRSKVPRYQDRLVADRTPLHHRPVAKTELDAYRPEREKPRDYVAEALLEILNEDGKTNTYHEEPYASHPAVGQLPVPPGANSNLNLGIPGHQNDPRIVPLKKANSTSRLDTAGHTRSSVGGTIQAPPLRVDFDLADSSNDLPTQPDMKNLQGSNANISLGEGGDYKLKFLRVFGKGSEEESPPEFDGQLKVRGNPDMELAFRPIFKKGLLPLAVPLLLLNPEVIIKLSRWQKRVLMDKLYHERCALKFESPLKGDKWSVNAKCSYATVFALSMAVDSTPNVDGRMLYAELVGCSRHEVILENIKYMREPVMTLAELPKLIHSAAYCLTNTKYGVIQSLDHDLAIEAIQAAVASILMTLTSWRKDYSISEILAQKLHGLLFNCMDSSKNPNEDAKCRGYKIALLYKGFVKYVSDAKDRVDDNKEYRNAIVDVCAAAFGFAPFGSAANIVAAPVKVGIHLNGKSVKGDLDQLHKDIHYQVRNLIFKPLGREGDGIVLLEDEHGLERRMTFNALARREFMDGANAVYACLNVEAAQ